MLTLSQADSLKSERTLTWKKQKDWSWDVGGGGGKKVVVFFLWVLDDGCNAKNHNCRERHCHSNSVYLRQDVKPDNRRASTFPPNSFHTHCASNIIITKACFTYSVYLWILPLVCIHSEKHLDILNFNAVYSEDNERKLKWRTAETLFVVSCIIATAPDRRLCLK